MFVWVNELPSADPQAPTVDGDGIVLASHLREIYSHVRQSIFYFIFFCFFDFLCFDPLTQFDGQDVSGKSGREVAKRALKMLKRMDHVLLSQQLSQHHASLHEVFNTTKSLYHVLLLYDFIVL